MKLCPDCGAELLLADGNCPKCLIARSKSDSRAGNEDSPTIIDQPGEKAATKAGAPEKLKGFGDYELLEEIARGGMGVVYKARQISLNRIVAVKMILAGQMASEAEVMRFRTEAEAAANLQHPNIVAIHEVGEHNGHHYFSMDYVEGKNLAEFARGEAFDSMRAAKCVQTLAEAVHFAHQRGTLHRDLKPQNVLIDAAGRPRITDFGLAKFLERDDSLTQAGAVMGSPSYMPPEQAAGHLDQMGPHSDVYALGAILYELLAQRPPFLAGTAVATMRLVMESEPETPRKLNPTVPPDLETVCLKCLEKNPARRYHSARALAEELGRFLNHEPIQALPASGIRKMESWLRGHPWTLVATASFVVLVLMGLLYWQFERTRFLQNRPLATDEALIQPGLRRRQLQSWDDFRALVVMMVSGLLIYQKYPRTKKGPAQPMSHRARIACGLISLAALAFTALYFAKLIQVSVWETTPRFSLWLWVYANFALSLSLLSWVARDYQKSVHGIPSRTLSAGQNELLLRAIYGGDTVGAIKLYRRTIPDTSLAEARDFVGKLTAELKARHPEKFAPPSKWLDLNWRAMGICLVVEIGVIAGFWTMMVPRRMTPSVGILVPAEGFLFGAGFIFSMQLKAFFWRSLVMALYPIVVFFAARFSRDVTLYFGGFAFGAGMILSGFTRRRRKS